MVKALKQFVVNQLKEPTEKKLNNDIEWLCSSLGFITPRDQEKTAFKILTALIKSAKQGKGMTSEELTKVVGLSIGSVIYHLKRLMKAGLVVKMDSNYELKMNSLLTTMEEVEKDIGLTLDNIKKIAEDIDDNIGLGHR